MGLRGNWLRPLSNCFTWDGKRGSADAARRLKNSLLRLNSTKRRITAVDRFKTCNTVGDRRAEWTDYLVFIFFFFFIPSRVIGPIRLWTLWERSENVEAKISLSSRQSHFVPWNIFQLVNRFCWLMLLKYVITSVGMQGCGSEFRLLAPHSLISHSRDLMWCYYLSAPWHEFFFTWLSAKGKCKARRTTWGHSKWNGAGH